MDDHLLFDIIGTRPLLVLGVGNPLRGDDAIGHLLAEYLERFNDNGFQAHAVGVAVENSMRWVRETAGGRVLLVDAVFDELLPEGQWALYSSDQIDSMCHTTHSIELSLLMEYWKHEVPDIQIDFLGISIRSSRNMAPLSPTLEKTLHSLKSLFTAR
jgi:hydrogenase maturation protease